MTGVATALCAAISIDNSADAAPEWLHLLPAGTTRGVDGRGPYTLPRDVDRLIAASLPAGARLPICVNHATDIAAPRGGESPARGWIVELQGRADGLYGRVEWTGEGRRMVEEREYRGVSPVIGHLGDGTVTKVLRATLTNTPNLAGLKALHSQEQGMDWRTTLIELLKLDSTADDAAITAAIAAWKEKVAGDGGVALQAALAPITALLGLDAKADAAAVIAGVEALKTGEGDVVALQAEVRTLTEDRKRDKAIAFVEAGIGAGRVGLKPVRDEYIAMHMADPARTEKLVRAMPTLEPGRKHMTAPGDAAIGAETNVTLLAAKATVYQAEQAKGGVTISYATAVRVVADQEKAA